MLYGIYKEQGLIGTGFEKTDVTFAQIENDFPLAVNRTALAVFDTETNTVHIINDETFDVSSLVEKFKIYCDIPNKHKFNINR